VPTPPNTSGGLFGVKALSTTGACAVGESFPNAGGNGKILTDHWNGTSWQVVNAPPVVGFWVTDVAGNSVVLHWTGTAWKEETTPSASNLFRVAVLPTNELFTSEHGTIFVGQFPAITHRSYGASTQSR
jgi:hypothetical protein